MAEKLNVRQSYYSDVENGRRTLTSKFLSKLEDVTNVSKDWMYTGKGIMLIGEQESNGQNGDEEKTPGTASREYYKRMYDKIEIPKDDVWNQRYNTAVELLRKIENYRQQIVSIKILLDQQLNIKERNGGGKKMYEKAIIDRYGGEAVHGNVRAKYSTSEELNIFIDDLFELANILELRFFELFRILHMGLRKDELHYDPPKLID